MNLNLNAAANLVEFLCSDKASFITSQSIFGDGGLSVVGNESLAVASRDRLWVHVNEVES